MCRHRRRRQQNQKPGDGSEAAEEAACGGWWYIRGLGSGGGKVKVQNKKWSRKSQNAKQERVLPGRLQRPARGGDD